MAVNYQKVWRTMNDLEMVTSKICSIRANIDVAIDKLQEHQYDKAEMLMSAAYEFLEYYLQEFDDKFKLAWQATVGDLRDGDVSTFSCDNDDPSPECRGAWNSFWSDHDGSTVSSVQYTEEELNAMCDEAESDEQKERCREYNLREAEYYDKKEKLDMTYDEAVAAGWEMTADGFWILKHKEEKAKKWVLPVEEVKDADTDETEYFFTLPQELLDAANLKEGDRILWIDNNDGTFTIKKPPVINYQEAIAAGWEMTEEGFSIKQNSSLISSQDC